ncbi:TetR family transcriptional regulator [Jatrophihabitans sp. GAS493]|uniref:TetR/AcrR family transcriptional regulator n=1 Tax=Jatrophihabitans sp. GAS493 TaxID=1907575 RepID=UPI000BB94C29|nr:TetR/AcrR family transcriptional regulator [Jatrophihabitans sp. GAS493]SOD70484.1 TetR family transcriptional regulator [Jatrophihabitans sp. GAS493]
MIGPATTATVSRRDRVRAETTAEIKQLAWEVMAESGPAGLSLRAVARQMGMAPSALYRYFPSRDDLLTALIIEGFDSLGAALQEAYARSRAQTPKLPATEVFVVVAKSYRQWALEHPTPYGLIFGSAVPGYTGTEATTEASMRSVGALMQTMLDLVAEGRLAVDRITPRLTPELVDELNGWVDCTDGKLPVAALAAAMDCYATLHGVLSLEVNRHLPASLSSSSALFEFAIRDVLERISL